MYSRHSYVVKCMRCFQSLLYAMSLSAQAVLAGCRQTLLPCRRRKQKGHEKRMVILIIPLRYVAVLQEVLHISTFTLDGHVHNVAVLVFCWPVASPPQDLLMMLVHAAYKLAGSLLSQLIRVSILYILSYLQPAIASCNGRLQSSAC